jgi:two-component system sensor histidine kinase TctE
MPLETRAPVAANASSAGKTKADETRTRPSWRANVRALTTVIGAASRRNTAAEPPPKPAFNPLRLQEEQRSLFGEILDWMLAPLLLLWPMSVTITYLVAQSIANAPYDRNLSSSVEVVAGYTREAGGRVTLDLPSPVRDLLHADAIDDTYYMVLGTSGEFVAGDRDLPLPPEDERPAAGKVKLRFDRLSGQEIRVAYSWVEFRRARTADGGKYALVQVAETLEKRAQLANEIIRGVIVPQFIVLPAAVVLVWFGLSRGLAPLNALKARIRARRPDDLSPIDTRAAPEEISPLVASFNELLERLRQNIEVQKRFLADAAHQMRTPLAGVRTQAELALRETSPNELRRSLRQIASASERATHLINQLLALARVEHQSSNPSAFEVFDLNALARDCMREWVAEAIARGIDLGFEGTDEPARIIGVPMLLRELLNNVLDNALRFTASPPAGPGSPAASVTVRVRKGAGSVWLEVEDTGPGIPEAERHLVFDRFYRVLGTNIDGSGLGLAIVREIVEQHDAMLRIGNNPRTTDPARPGTLLSIEFVHTPEAQPTVNLESA